MKIAKRLMLAALGIVVVALAAGYFYLNAKQPKRSGEIRLAGLTSEVEVHYDRWAVPHIYAKTEADAYYALGYLHAQERLFHMELLRRLAKGQLAEILGPALVETDTFFRTLRLKQFGEETILKANRDLPAYQVGESYFKGVNLFIANGPTPVEFDLLGIPKTPFSMADMISVAGYMAYSFAAGFKTDPLLTVVRDQWGAGYLEDLETAPSQTPPLKLLAATHPSMQQLAGLVADIEARFAPLGAFEGSNAWAVSGRLTRSGKAILAGDPHIAFSAPSVWYEAHIVTPDFELYGHYLSGFPYALLGLNRNIAWSLTMFQNDDVDLYVEKANPENPNQVWSDGQWTPLASETERIKVKGQADLEITVRRSKHGPIINDVITGLGSRKDPVAARWGFHDPDNKVMEPFYRLARAKNAQDAQAAMGYLRAPGLNIVLADAEGNIAWWAAGAVPIRPAHVDPNFLLDGASGLDDYQGYLPFSQNPQFINPASGVIVSANHQPQDFGTGTVPGYYNLPDRARRIEHLLEAKPDGWTLDDMKSIQRDTRSTLSMTVRDQVVAVLKPSAKSGATPLSSAAMDQFARWNGDHRREDVGPTVFATLQFFLMEMTFRDELGDDLFKAFLQTRLPYRALTNVMSREASPWWDDHGTPAIETRAAVVAGAWQKTLTHLSGLLGNDPAKWTWGKVHRVEYVHPIGRKKPLDKIFNIGPLAAEGGNEVPNFMGFRFSPAPHHIYICPSTRRIIDFGAPEQSVGINPTGQSGYFFNENYDDQAVPFVEGEYRRQLLAREDVMAQKVSSLRLMP
ncbi:MAG: penicillin acylase family protein [Pseudomonadota bacterium]